MDTNRYLAAIEGGESDDFIIQSPDKLAATLGGVWIRPGTIAMPSPGSNNPDDRSLIVKIDPSCPQEFYIYDCTVAHQLAIDHINFLLLSNHQKTTPKTNIKFLHQLWSETLPADLSPVDTYLRARAITIPLPPSIRFHPHALHPNRQRYPAMCVQRQDVNGEYISLHRTYLDPHSNPTVKADLTHARTDLGKTNGAALRLFPAVPHLPLVITEGIEDALSVTQETKKPSWAAGSARALRNLILPPEIRTIEIWADNDSYGVGAAQAAGSRWKAEGRTVNLRLPPTPYKDFNEFLVASQ